MQIQILNFCPKRDSNTTHTMKNLLRYFSSVSNTQSSSFEALGISSKSCNAGVFDGESWAANGPMHEAINPSTGEVLALVQQGNVDDYKRCVRNTVAAQKEWQLTPAPMRGEIVRQIGNSLRKKKDALGALLSLEMGKIYAEGQGEV